MSLNQLDEFLRTLKNCPHCGSDEGFWLAVKLYKKFLQCKHCGALIELFDAVQKDENGKESKFKVLKKK